MDTVADSAVATAAGSVATVVIEAATVGMADTAGMVDTTMASGVDTTVATTMATVTMVATADTEVDMAVVTTVVATATVPTAVDTAGSWPVATKDPGRFTNPVRKT